MAFETSTHAKHWIFTRQELDEIRRKRDESASESVDEASQSLLRRHYESKIQEICASLQLPSKCQAAAVIYFKRFYLRNSLVDHDGKTIMLTCTYLSGKTEEYNQDIAAFCKIMKIDPNSILSREMVVLESLRFHLKVFHPYRPLHGFVLDFHQHQSNPQLNTTVIYDQATKELNTMMLTDIPLLYQPTHMALAALRRAVATNNADEALRTYLEARIGSEDYFKEVRQAMDQIDDELARFGTLDLEQVRKIDRTVRLKAKAIADKREELKAQQLDARDTRRVEKLTKDSERNAQDNMELLLGGKK